MERLISGVAPVVSDLLPTKYHAMRRPKIRAKKSLGQNFLTNEAVADKIVESVGDIGHELVVEIGPGTGMLTRRLVRKAEQVVAVELDSALFDLLKRDFSADTSITLLCEDFLDLDLNEVCERMGRERLSIVGNIPYNITGPVIERLLRYRDRVNAAVIMTQEEVGLRLSAEPGNKIYGALSAIVQYTYGVERLFRVTRGDFRPQPAVQSVVLRFTPHRAPPVSVCDDALLVRVIKAAFQHRRKMLHHAVNRLLPSSAPKVAEESGLDLTRRAETLSLDEFARLTDSLRNSGLQ